MFTVFNGSDNWKVSTVLDSTIPDELYLEFAFGPMDDFRRFQIIEHSMGKHSSPFISLSREEAGKLAKALVEFLHGEPE